MLISRRGEVEKPGRLSLGGGDSRYASFVNVREPWPGVGRRRTYVDSA